jgi:hypothetical protein
MVLSNLICSIALSCMTLLSLSNSQILPAFVPFNFEITKRVTDLLSSYTQTIDQAIRIPHIQVSSIGIQSFQTFSESFLEIVLHPVKDIFYQVIFTYHPDVYIYIHIHIHIVIKINLLFLLLIVSYKLIRIG